MIQIAHAITNVDHSFADADDAYCEMLQLTPAELRKRDILSITFNADRAQNGAALHQLIIDATPFWIRKRYIRDDGSLIWVLTRHAMAIDEYRKDFARVPLGGSHIRPKQVNEPDPLDQVWFAGDHSDIGGSYPEQESRLSDISLKWMSDFIADERNKRARDDPSLGARGSPVGVHRLKRRLRSKSSSGSSLLWCP